jgi:hypothetical protein
MDVSRRVRRTVHAFLLVLAVTGLAHIELWPLTGFRLFSELRGSTREGWAIVAVDPAGAEHTIDLQELPVGYRYTSKILEHFSGLSAEERDDVCDAWSGPRRAGGDAVMSVRVYRETFSVRPHGPPPIRHLAYECGSAR